MTEKNDAVDCSIVESVSERDDWFSISTVDSWGFGLKKSYGYTPQVGDRIAVAMNHFGGIIRGVYANGNEIFYKTDEDLEKERQEWLTNRERELQEKFEHNREDMDADYAVLPSEFRQRIDRFRANNPRFRIDYESYELFVCQQAILIAQARQIPRKVRSLQKMTWKHQVKAVPGLSDAHSGNTFGMACKLAYVYLRWPEKVYQVHGALSTLVGSKTYGDLKPGAVDQQHSAPAAV